MSTSLYSAFIVEEPWPGGRIALFDYGRGQLVPGVSTVIAQSYHTNMPRMIFDEIPKLTAVSVRRG